MERDRSHRIQHAAGRVVYACRAYAASHDLTGTPSEITSMREWRQRIVTEAKEGARALAVAAGASNATATAPEPPKAVSAAKKADLAMHLAKRAEQAIAASKLGGATATRIVASEIWAWVGGLDD